NRTKSSVPSEVMIESTPLCPAPEPPRLMRILQSGRSSSSYTTQVCSGVRPVSLSALATAWPERFMQVWGMTSHTPRASDRPTSDCQRFFSIEMPRRRASSRTQATPMLWRVSAYSDSGLPSPTISRFSWSPVSCMQTQLGPRRAPQTPDWSVPRPVRLQGDVGQPPHLFSLGWGPMVPTEQVQQPVHQQHGELGLRVMTPHFRLLQHGRPSDGNVTAVLPPPRQAEHV